LDLNYLQTIVGAAGMHTFNLGLVPSPLEKLEDSCRLFQEAAETSKPAMAYLVSFIVLFIRGQLTGYFRQPRLLMLRQKVLQLFSSNLKDAAPSHPHGKFYNEVTIDEQIGLVIPKHRVVTPVELLLGTYGSGTTRRDIAVGSTNLEGMSEPSDMSQCPTQDVVMGEVYTIAHTNS
jgi:hypothetical protein